MARSCLIYSYHLKAIPDTLWFPCLAVVVPVEAGRHCIGILHWAHHHWRVELEDAEIRQASLQTTLQAIPQEGQAMVSWEISGAFHGVNRWSRKKVANLSVSLMLKVSSNTPHFPVTSSPRDPRRICAVWPQTFLVGKVWHGRVHCPRASRRCKYDILKHTKTATSWW